VQAAREQWDSIVPRKYFSPPKERALRCTMRKTDGRETSTAPMTYGEAGNRCGTLVAGNALATLTF
jgi:hypothetical protein